MKRTTLRIVSLMSLIVPMFATAQNNIMPAFDAIIKCKDAQIVESHSLEKDPKNHTKTSQYDTYRFVLPADKMNLVRNAVSAIEKDADKAYSLCSGKTTAGDDDIFLAVGDGSGDGIQVTQPDSRFIYAAFLAPHSEDSQGIYRYAYGMNYKEEDGNIVGKLVVTYAMTLQHRQHLHMQQQQEYYRSITGGSPFPFSSVIEQPTWFDTMMSYFQSMPSANPQTRIALASKAYKMIQEMPDYDVTASDKDTIREILKGMLSDKMYSETVLNNLLNQCLVEIK